MKLNPKAFGIVSGILWGSAMFLMTIFVNINGYASDFLIMMAGIYPGYSQSYFGAIIGTAYGFADGFVGGWLFAWLYNKLVKG
mgnify:FL=1